MSPPIRLATRQSHLALIQARFVQAKLAELWPERDVILVHQSTQGDRQLDVPIHQLAGGYGAFVKELEVLLLNGEADLAIHSLKDMPSVLPEGLAVFPVGPREDVRDCLLCPSNQTLDTLPDGARIGTASLRRQAILNRYYPHLLVQSVRGNLNTRLRKLEAGEVDALILAAAGIHRLGWTNRITEYFDPTERWIPAVAQGALGLEGRVDNPLFQELKAIWKDSQLTACITAERSAMKALEGGCQTPLGIYAQASEHTVMMHGQLLSPDGRQVVKHQMNFSLNEDVAIQGQQFAETMLSQGGVAIRDAIEASRHG